MGEMMFVLQGLRNNTLVAGKTTAIRLFTDPTQLAAVDRVEATILRADGSQVVHSWSKTEFVAVPKSSLGPSVVVRVPGSLLPWVGNYDLQAKLFDGAGAVWRTIPFRIKFACCRPRTCASWSRGCGREPPQNRGSSRRRVSR